MRRAQLTLTLGMAYHRGSAFSTPPCVVHDAGRSLGSEMKIFAESSFFVGDVSLRQFGVTSANTLQACSLPPGWRPCSSRKIQDLVGVWVCLLI